MQLNIEEKLLSETNFNYLLIAMEAGIAWIIPVFILKAGFYRNIVKAQNGI